MVALNLGYTAPINRPGQTPVLTLPQIWEGLKYKVRRAERFVPIITDCEVLSEEKQPSAPGGDGNIQIDVIRRAVTFAPGNAPPGSHTTAGGNRIEEVCRLYPPCRIDFMQEDGTAIGNYVSRGPSGEETDLWMTYVFQWKVPGVEEGSEEAGRWEEQFRKTAKTAVEGSIETIRKIFAGEIAMD